MQRGNRSVKHISRHKNYCTLFYHPDQSIAELKRNLTSSLNRDSASYPGLAAGAVRISVRTVGTHASNILGKLDVPSRTAAVAHARHAGALQQDPVVLAIGPVIPRNEGSWSAHFRLDLTTTGLSPIPRKLGMTMGCPE
jgi:hypothetical protein